MRLLVDAGAEGTELGECFATGFVALAEHLGDFLLTEAVGVAVGEAGVDVNIDGCAVATVFGDVGTGDEPVEESAESPFLA